MTLKNSYIYGLRRNIDVLQISGDDALRFLQGMWTADFKLASTAPPSTFGAYLLDLKAKPIAPAQVLCLSAKNFLLFLPKGRGSAVFEALDRYLVADDVTLEIMEQPYQVVDVLESPFVEGEYVDKTCESFRVPAPISLDKSVVSRAVFVKDLGAYVLPVGELSSSHFQILYEVKAALPQFTSYSEQEWTRLHIQSGKARWEVDYGPDSLILEYPYQSKISFHKGCYIGQEVVARGTYRGQVAKSFARFHCDADAFLGFVYRKEDRAKPVGKVTSAAGAKALGQLRLREYENHEHVLVDEQSSREVNILKIDVLSSQKESAE